LVLAEILEASEKVKDSVGKTAFIDDDISPAMLLPRNRSAYFRYDGSLTTPGCGEAVIWTIYTHSLPISIDQIEQFKAIKTSEGHKLTHNFRSLQPLNHRPLVYVTNVDPQHHFSGASTLSAPVLACVLVFVKLLF
jgi:carbonic anhydrase